MNVPHFEQELSYSCLPACVRMVLAFWGHETSAKNLRILFKTRPAGTSPVKLLLQLPSLGFNATIHTASQSLLRQYLEAGFPCITHVDTEFLPHWSEGVIHAVVITAVDNESVTLNDPSVTHGPLTVPLPNFLRAWASTDYLLVVIEPEQKFD